jgi:pyrroline-5-carboxylate reductase
MVIILLLTRPGNAYHTSKMMATNSSNTPLIISFAAGAATAWIGKLLFDRKKEAKAKANGECLCVGVN